MGGDTPLFQTLYKAAYIARIAALIEYIGIKMTDFKFHVFTSYAQKSLPPMRRTMAARISIIALLVGMRKAGLS